MADDLSALSADELLERATKLGMGLRAATAKRRHIVVTGCRGGPAGACPELRSYTSPDGLVETGCSHKYGKVPDDGVPDWCPLPVDNAPETGVLLLELARRLDLCRPLLAAIERLRAANSPGEWDEANNAMSAAMDSIKKQGETDG